MHTRLFFKIAPLIFQPIKLDAKDNWKEIKRKVITHYTAILTSFEQQLGLRYQESNQIGRICYAQNNTDLRDDFKISFDSEDLFEYLYAWRLFEVFEMGDAPSTSSVGLALNKENIFWKTVSIGKKLLDIQLNAIPSSELKVGLFPISGQNLVSKDILKRYTLTQNGLGRIWINTEQYFDQIPQKAWSFSIQGNTFLQEFIRQKIGTCLSQEDLIFFHYLLQSIVESQILLEKMKQF